jgi:D-alanine-D-alanine ligase
VPFNRQGNRLLGSGIAENKGGIAVALSALRALRFARALPSVRCGLLLTSDDTLNGVNGRSIVEQHAKRARHIVGLKAAGERGELIISRAGRATFHLEASYGKGKSEATPGHVIGHLFRRLVTLQKLSDPDAGIHVSVRRIGVDAPFGRLPDSVEATVTTRFNRPEDGAALLDHIRGVARKRSTGGVSFHVSGGLRRPPLVSSEANQTFYDDIADIGSSINVPVLAGHRWHSSDLCFAPSEIPKIDGMGPIGGDERTEREYVIRSSLIEHAALLALVIRHCRLRPE